ncbi:MAG: hypothetical protein L0Z73_17190 [Gammaproteobacteria bacterium]|nr:hypothetical protein [Gammaproteobacteria bacterium]
MIGRIVVSIGMFFAGYYIGKQYGLTEQIRRDLSEKRNQKQPAGSTAEKSGAVQQPPLQQTPPKKKHRVTQ